MSEKKPVEQKDTEKKTEKKQMSKEFGGFENKPEPTRYGDWDANGRCSDF